MAGQLLDFLAELLQSAAVLGAQLGEPIDVDAHADVLQVGQHVDQRHLDVGVQLRPGRRPPAAAARIGSSRSGTSASSAA